MERTSNENSSRQGTAFLMINDTQLLHPLNTTSGLAQQVLEEVISQGVIEFCLCPGSRNAPLVYPLIHSDQVRLYYWPEERSAAFFALGRIKATGRPVAVVTTSGTAAAELLPATIEAYYTGLPLILITADRPRRLRGTGAPQSAEQVGLFSHYIHEGLDLAEDSRCELSHWTREGPLHLNVCFEEPKDQECQQIRLNHCEKTNFLSPSRFSSDERFLLFLKKTHFPFIVVGSLPAHTYEAAIEFLLHLNAPLYLEGMSGIREDSRLAHLRITRMENIWKISTEYGYPIDGILRLGSVPTLRLWRDLEEKKERIPVCSISEQPFSGLSYTDVIHTSLLSFFEWGKTIDPPCVYHYHTWKEADQRSYQALLTLFQEEPQAESSLVHELSKKIPLGSKVYLGNSLPIREWDQAATYEPRRFQIGCNRGINGIDGQLATFLGYSSDEQENWSLLGDLTLLYDLVAPWISTQLLARTVNIVLINNGGAKIFSRMFAHPAFQHQHQLNFKPLAEFWNWNYEKWESIPASLSAIQGARLIELIPDALATERFFQKVKEIK